MTATDEPDDTVEPVEPGGAAEPAEPAETAEPAEPDAAEPAAAEPVATGLLAWCRKRWVTVLTVGALVVSALSAGSVYWFLYRPDRLTDTAVQEQVLAAARGATEALLSYSPESVDKDVAAAKNNLTGDFLTKYTEFADTVVVPAARQRGVKTEATVARAAISQMRPDSANVLVFVNQVTTSKERPTPALATSSVIMTLVRSDGRWLVSEFNPV